MRRTVRTASLLAALAACGAAGVLPALAADQDVVARNLRFQPQQVALKPGETLTVRHDDGATAHTLWFDGEDTARQKAGIGWTVQRTFTAAEERAAPYGFYCDLHPGMSGAVYVNATGTVPAPTPWPTTTATPTPAASPAPGGGGTTGGSGTTQGGSGSTQGGGTTQGAGATLRSARMLTAVACTRQGPRCSKPGVVLRIDLSAPADARAALTRRAAGAPRFKAFGTVRFGRVAAGPRELSFRRTAAGRRLTAARYRMTLRAAGAQRTLAFRVR